MVLHLKIDCLYLVQIVGLSGEVDIVSDVRCFLYHFIGFDDKFLYQYRDPVRQHQHGPHPDGETCPEEFLVECKCVVKKDPGKAQAEDDERPVHQNFDAHVGIAGTKGRPLGRIQKSIDLEVVTPGQKQHNDAPEENEVFLCLGRDAHFGKCRWPAFPWIKFTLQLKCTIFQIPPGSDQPCQDEEDEEPVSHVHVKRKREEIKPDIFVKDGLRAPDRFPVEIAKDHVPLVGALCRNHKAENQDKRQEEGI